MTCPHCESTATSGRVCRTALGYRRFNCRSCQRRFNERTGTGFNDLQYPWGGQMSRGPLVLVMGSVRTQTTTRNPAPFGAGKQLPPSLTAGRATTRSRACKAPWSEI